MKIISGDTNGQPDDWDEIDFGSYADEYFSVMDDDDAGGDGAEAFPFAEAETLPCTYVGPSAAIARHTTDVGNAQRFAAQHGADVRYCYAWKSWLFWDGSRWKIDDSGEIERKAKKTARTIADRSRHHRQQARTGRRS